MKKQLLLLLIISLLSCTNISRVNNKINEVQKQHLLVSPYKDAKRTLTRIETQKQFRLKYLPKLLRSKIYGQNISDTLLLLEDFDEICANCSSYRMQVLYKDTIYFVEKEVLGDKLVFKAKKQRMNYTLANKYTQYDYFELAEIKNKMSNHQNWKANPLEYGSDDCADGNHILITAIYPNEEMDALYVRCWWPEYDRIQLRKN